MNEQANAKEIGLFSRIISIFWEPSKTFKGVAKKADWWDILIPILLITIAAWVTIPNIGPIGMESAKERIENSQSLSDSQKQEMLKNMEEREEAGSIMPYITTPITMFVMIAIVAMVMWLVGNFFLAGERKFIPVFAMTSYAFLVNILGTLVKTPLMVKKNTLEIYTGLATIMPQSDSYFFELAKQIDIFAIWKVVLLGIGLSILYKSEQKKSLIVVALIWLVYALGAAAVSGFSPF